MESTAHNDVPPPSPRDIDRVSPLQWTALGGIVVLAVVLRLLWIGSFEANFDELWHLEVSTGRGTAHTTLPKNVLIEQAPDVTSLRDAPPWTAVWSHMYGNTHPPLYWIALRLWREAFAGDSLAKARSMNVIFSAASIAAMFWTVRLLSGTAPALWAALIMTLSSGQIEAAQEVRNYPLATVCWLCAAGIVAGAQRRGRLSRPATGALIFATVATLLSLYGAGAAIVATLVYALIRLRGVARTRAVGAILAGAVLFAALWGPQFLRQRESFATQAAVDRTDEQRLGDHLPHTFQRAATVPLRMLFEPRKTTTLIACLSAVMYLLPWLMLRRHPDALLWGLSLLAIVGAVFALDLFAGTQQLDMARHVVIAGPAVAALIAILAVANKWYLRIVPPAVALACAAALGQTYLRQNPQFSDIGKYLSDPATASEPVVFYSDPRGTFWSEWLFVGAAHYSGTFPRPVVRLDAPIQPEVLKQLHARWPHVWVVSGMSDLRPEQIVPGTTAVDVKHNPFLGSVTRLRWTSPPPPSEPSTGPTQ
jgi:hypothetical protein